MSKDYYLSINDNSFKNPFLVNDKIIRLATHFSKYDDDYDKLYSLFDWTLENIRYKKGSKYKDSVEVLQKGRGVCAETAILYTTIARCMGFCCNYASVKIDNSGEKVRHACSALELERRILVDIAYETFDIHHKKYKVLKDIEVIKRFFYWNA